jgi:hypothetical protein
LKEAEMKEHAQVLTKFMILVIVLVMCGLPEAIQAQNAAPQSSQSGTTIDPSKGPLEPVPSQNQPADVQPSQNPEIAPAPQAATPTPQPKPEQQMQEPLGTATAEGVPTVGGGASRPAGAAIAPAKQSQRRSLLLKLGAIAAVGVAGGTIYALSKGTSARP